MAPNRGNPKHEYYTTELQVCQVVFTKRAFVFLKIYQTFFQKGVAFFFDLCYTIMRLRVPLRSQTRLSASTEVYRSGHNGLDSKFCSHFGTSHLKSLDL